jgi:hypothetical protein
LLDDEFMMRPSTEEDYKEWKRGKKGDEGFPKI